MGRLLQIYLLLAILTVWPISAIAKGRSVTKTCGQVVDRLRSLVQKGPVSGETIYLQLLTNAGYVVPSGSRFATPRTQSELLSAILTGRMQKIGAADPSVPSIQTALELIQFRLNQRQPLNHDFFEVLDRVLLPAKRNARVAPNLSDTALYADWERTRNRAGDAFSGIKLDHQKIIDYGHLKAPEKYQTLHEVDRLNELTLARLNTVRPPTASVDPAKLQSIFEKVRQDPLVNFCDVSKAASGESKFCYGGPLVAHFESVRQGVPRDSIKKVFLVGKPEAGGQIWDYQSALAVHGSDGRWWVIDQNLPKPVPVEDWYRKLTEAQGTGVTRLYFTDPHRIDVESAGSNASRAALQDSALNDRAHKRQFEQMLLNYRKESQKILEDSRREGFWSPK